jgi:carbon monoxide dehydrogenase subunit G
MKLENEFTVGAPVERAWEVMLDMRRVAPCLPGAAIESSDGDEHVGTMAIKIGPITSRYRGTVRVLEADEAARRAVMRAQARDQRGQGTAAATITSTMEAVPDGTRVRVETEMQVTGPAAQFGRGVMQDVSAKLMRRFAECLADEIAEGDLRGTAAVADEPVASGTAGIRLPPGPAAAAAEAAAAARGRGRSRASSTGAPSRSGASPPAADDVASRRRPAEDVLDLGAVGREAVLKRVAPVAAVLAALAVVAALLRRRAR